MLPEDDVRQTPPELFAELWERFKFDLDVCATPQNAQCTCFYSEQGYHNPVEFEPGLNGLTGSWKGARAWCNPPFSDIAPWVMKAWESEAELVCMLVPATRTEQGWWADMIEPFRDGRPSLVPGWNLTTEFLRGRQHFLKDGKPILGANGKRSSPKFGCVILVWQKQQ